MPKSENVILQEKIQGQFADQVKANREKLCWTCAYWWGDCRYGLVPVTSEGKDCPYFQKRSNDI